MLIQKRKSSLGQMKIIRLISLSDSVDSRMRTENWWLDLIALKLLATLVKNSLGVVWAKSWLNGVQKRIGSLATKVERLKTERTEEHFEAKHSRVLWNKSLLQHHIKFVIWIRANTKSEQ